ncbi:hypothetical protein [Chitinophaga sp. LS1]|uniref:hypothetical protein n=1 Tax=Chitinophaga sp. LS1 TaxID=3051176 RepID=UPI002AABED87|nr:hypothetical protein [Chitinophaga sp. LS1]WPV66704.1 hypothetical protein QQL36_33455 [Chitinophaga sp. LS1]
MDIRFFYSIYLPALTRALNEDDKNYGFFVNSPESFIDKDIELEIESFIDNELANDIFINMVDEYFDAKSHYFKEMNGVDIDIVKNQIIEGISKLKRIYLLE